MPDNIVRLPQPPAQWLEAARRSVSVEAKGMAELSAALDGALGQALCRAVATIKDAKGRVILAGMGKSGHIARKIASTLASTGTAALFVHPAEASHGDLGMIAGDDVVVMISNSGESAELRAILDYTRRFAVPLIAITARADSTLAREADVAMILPAAQEACPNGLAPTTSTLMQLALGDAIAITLLEDKGFTARDFGVLHPGGKLGAQLMHVREFMRRPPDLPLCAPDTAMSEAIVVMTAKHAGCIGVAEAGGRLLGIITDGDLRRHMQADLLALKAESVMTRNPLTIAPDALASEALELLNRRKITSLFVVDEARVPLGLIHIHDLLKRDVG